MTAKFAPSAFGRPTGPTDMGEVGFKIELLKMAMNHPRSIAEPLDDVFRHFCELVGLKVPSEKESASVQ